MVDPITLLIGVAGGAGAGLLISYFAFFAKPKEDKVHVLQREESGQVKAKSVTVSELEASKREMRTLILERDLLAQALTKIYEAETQGKITREEREMIAKRYSEQIRDFEGKLRGKELVVEVGELESLRDELLSLFKEKIQNIESRLEQAKERLPSLREELKPVAATKKVVVAPQLEELEKAVERKAPRREGTEGERRVRELREEVMEALARLEQIDTKKESEGA